MSLHAVILGTASLFLCGAVALQAQTRTAASRLSGHIVDIEAGEFFFRGPDTISAGLTTFRLRQVGLVQQRVRADGAALDSMTLDQGDQTRGFHMLWIMRLDSGKTVADFARAVQANTAKPWAKSLGGPGFVLPPNTTNATLVLEPGIYVLVRQVGSLREDRSRHHTRNGMFRGPTVMPSQTPTAPMPKADVVVRIAEDGTLHFSGPAVSRPASAASGERERRRLRVPAASRARGSYRSRGVCVEATVGLCRTRAL